MTIKLQNILGINAYFVQVNETENLDLQRFWKLQSLGICDCNSELFSQKDLDALDFFNDNLNFVNGKYYEKLLWKINKNELKLNFDVAEHRLCGLKSKLCKNKWLLNKYEEILMNNLSLDIIKECKVNENK